MTMARDEYIFLIILAVNLIVSVLYLAAGIVLMVPAHASLADGNDEEILYDNRRKVYERSHPAGP